MAMQPSMWTSYLYPLEVRKAVTLFSEHGWSTLELSDEHAHELLAQGKPEVVGKEFKTFADDLGITFPQGHFYLHSLKAGNPLAFAVADIAPPDEISFAAAMEDMRRWVDLFQAIGIRAGVLHAGGRQLMQAGWEPQRILERRVQALSQVAEYARGGPTIICLENCPGDRTASWADLHELITAVNADNLAVCLDTGHARISQTDIPAFVRQAGACLQALHIADNLGQKDDHMLPYGRGIIDWPPVMQALHENGYDGLFNFEVPGESRCPIPVRLAKLDYALALARWMITEGRAHDPAPGSS